MSKRPTKAERERARLNAFDIGFEYFTDNPELDMASVLREAARRYIHDDQEYWAFYEGFRDARVRRDEYLREKREFESKP